MGLIIFYRKRTKNSSSIPFSKTVVLSLLLNIVRKPLGLQNLNLLILKCKKNKLKTTQKQMCL